MSPRDQKDIHNDTRGSINYLEAAAYTSVILLIAGVAVGWFDVMLPW